jgi:acetylornithine deacetylase
MQHICDEIAADDPDFKASFKTTLVREAFEVAEDEPIVQAVLRETQSLFGRQPNIGCSFAWMDSALLAAAGIPTVIFGPGGEGAHAVVEWADLDQLEQSAQVLLNVIKTFCS